MPIQVLGYDAGPFAQYHEEARGDRFIRQFLKLVFSGNYPPGGDALDLTNAGGTPAAPTTISPAAYLGVVDIDVLERGVTGGLVAGGGFCAIIAPNANTPLKFADLANLKLKIFTSGNTELGAGAYPASVLGDVVIIEVVYAR